MSDRAPRILEIPEPSLVVLVGASGSGKSTFARRHFKPTEVLSSDYYRGVVSDDESDQRASAPAFEVLHFIAQKRLQSLRTVVVDATNVQVEARKPLLALARAQHLFAVAIVLETPLDVCAARNAARPDRAFGDHVIRGQLRDLRRSLRHVKDEGFRHVWRLDPEAAASAQVQRRALWNDRRHLTGPFDIVGDVHGCYDELCDLLGELGYRVDRDAHTAAGPPGRTALFLGDLVDRGPASPRVLRLVMQMVRDGHALCLPGNHEEKLKRWLMGKAVKPTHGLQETITQFAAEPPAFKQEVERFIDGLVAHLVLDGGKLVVAHAGLKAELQGRASGAVREFCLYGETTGETDELGLPVRYPWAEDYRGQATVVYGHTPVPEPVWLNRTLCIDTGCVFGGSLTALRYPERELVAIPARRTYYQPIRPLVVERPVQQRDVLDIDDVSGKRVIETRYARNVIVRAENAAAALEVMSRFAVDPQWLIHLPPTMSPCETAASGPWLEHPREAFAFFAREGAGTVICEEKHMGSRALVVVCQSAAAAAARFAVHDGKAGVVVTRTGRPFFKDQAWEAELIARVGAAVTRAGLWDELATDWLLLDAELMPWSLKAEELIARQYAGVGSAATADVAALQAALAEASSTAPELVALRAEADAKAERVRRYIDAYRRYCWPVRTLDDARLAPFHLLASEGRVHVDRDHVWHLQTLARLAGDPLLLRTPYRTVALDDPTAIDAACAWWQERTEAGSEGLVVKPLSFLLRTRRGLTQPAVKVRGRDYLRIIYGPEYDAPANLERLRARSLAAKRSLAMREFVLGLEGLHRFVAREPLWRVHECVFGVLALESEPVDPRL
jgi:protein phosphatase